MATEIDWGAYLASRDKERSDQAERMMANLTPRERVLVREAAVMGHVLGAQAAGGIPREQYPKDSQVLRDVLVQCADFAPDKFPAIASLDSVVIGSSEEDED